ncbi:EpsG family protein [Treponema brennaborense]|uniref:EpsG family protein n=1 Tax=Treponema brennaborense (strain DSM 12168 / CIP 105900 / DD5/3) TaxID=906968 RepID=F4LIE1_TREBD|nr:EpsG family protein [Treponema brennaborense]AEE16182.1 hypothetical protein Trebr_0744 [Treponema brennaborense DSM 12168]
MLYTLPYCFAFCFILFCEFIPNECGTVSKKWLPSISIIFFLLIFLGFRGFIVTDWVSYYPYYDEVPTLFDNNVSDFINNYPWEKGFLLYSVILKSFCQNYFFFQFVSFFIDLLIIHKVLKCYVQRKYLPLAYAVFFVFQGFVIEVNLLRNSKAIMLFLLSVPYLLNKKFCKYVVLNCIGGLFHVSGFIYIPLYFLLNRTFNRKLILILFLIGNIFFFAKIKLISILLVSIAPFLSGSRFGSLITAYGLLADEFTSYSIGVGFIERMLSFFVVFHFQNKLLKDNKNLSVFVNLLYLFLFSYLYLAEVGILIQRITILFVAGYWVILPNIYRLLHKDKKNIFLVILFLYGILKMMVQCDEPNYSYTNILYEEPNYSQRLQLIKISEKNK